MTRRKTGEGMLLLLHREPGQEWYSRRDAARKGDGGLHCSFSGIVTRWKYSMNPADVQRRALSTDFRWRIVLLCRSQAVDGG